MNKKILGLNKYTQIIIVCLIVIFFGCEKLTEIESFPTGKDFNRGKIIGKPILKAQVNNLELKLIAAILHLDEKLIGNFSIKVYSIEYNTIDKSGNLTTASGALFIPVSSQALPLLSYQHGTETKREFVASEDPLKFSPEALAAASLGYITMVPDYLGFGKSNVIHPYHLSKISATTVIDFIRASKTFCDSNSVTYNSQLFLAGYSEGGYVTLATQKEIETNYSNEFSITASAPMAGAYDLEFSAEKVIQLKKLKYPGFVAYLLFAYDNYYNWNRLSQIFNKPYDSEVGTLFNGSKNFISVENNLPDSVSSLLTESFISGIKNKTDSVTIKALTENSLINWTPNAPMQLCHGDADSTVFVGNSIKAFEEFTRRGSNVTLKIIPTGTHESSVLPSVLLTIDFFSKYVRFSSN